MNTVHIVLSVFNGRPFIGEQIRSILDQTHREWELWVRDDGSTDGTGEVVESLAREDSRVHLRPRDGDRRGVSGGFSWLLEGLPDEVEYIACCDADDVWLPEKLSDSLAALARVEARYKGPILVHSDLALVDAELNRMGRSLWESMETEPEPVTLRRLLIENVATGPTLLFNRALLEKVRPIPSEVPHHDWWIALVATLFGRVVALPDETVLYRRHGANHTEAFARGRGRLRGGLGRVREAMGRAPDVRKWLALGARQAELLRERFGGDLSPGDAILLGDYADLPTLGVVRRKARVLRYLPVRSYGLVRTLGILARA